ncbi:MAG TPA: bifunctional pyr operon transcriptional regulator/uracil phosphoribosyltransferase PyrR [Verrucomicrobiales bacterium]|jgi:pyrimidine operon attenuation protein/uracil phosphoribosyltransferase|nr:bifunctional pyr operon transcriptional regulator/uracil phosphoribosyltransferase PyrR [Verrucomicrobiales bacterium]
MDNPGQQLLSAREVDTKIHRLAWQILEDHPRDPFVLIGIHKRGVPLARRLAKVLESERPDVRTGSLDITLYRDDPASVEIASVLGTSDIPFNLNGLLVVLVDDVLYTGRTIRAAIDALIDFGRPSKIELACLVDRGHRELPIQPDYCGMTRVTGPGEYLRLLLREEDGQDGLFLVKSKSDPVTGTSA